MEDENILIFKGNSGVSYSPHNISMSGDLFLALEKIDDNKYKVLSLSKSPEGMLKYFNINEFDSRDALMWGLYFGDRDIMKNKISNSRDAYEWAMGIGDKDIMIDKITDSHYAYNWGLHIGNRNVMINKITDPYSAYCWALNIGDRDVMIHKVIGTLTARLWASDIGDRELLEKHMDKMPTTFLKINKDDPEIEWIERNGESYVKLGRLHWDSIRIGYHCKDENAKHFIVLEQTGFEEFKVLLLTESPDEIRSYINFDTFEAADAFRWAMEIGDRDVMIDKITNSHTAYLWARYIGNRDVMINKVKDAYVAFFWANDIGDKEIMKEKAGKTQWARAIECVKWEDTSEK